MTKLVKIIVRNRKKSFRRRKIKSQMISRRVGKNREKKKIIKVFGE